MFNPMHVCACSYYWIVDIFVIGGKLNGTCKEYKRHFRKC